MLRATAIAKRFGRTLALDGVDFEARPGEIHALVGENGAGKTTLMNVLDGWVAPDSGEAMLDGKPLQAGSPRAALAAGIATVHQSPMLFERMTWEENLALGGFDPGAGGLDLADVAARARALAAKLGFELPSAGTAVENRSVAERVRLEVLRALSFNPRVLILDEPTSVLAPSELAAFLDLLRNLRGEGRIVVLITHKLAEAIAVADRITVLRRGRVVARTTPGETSEEKLAALMIGEIVTQPNAIAMRMQAGDTVLQIENLSLEDNTGRKILDRLSFKVAAGEVVGIAGIDGNGQTELVEVLADVRRPSGGKITSDGELAVIPQNRDLDGLILDMRLWENLILARPLREQATSHGWLNTARAAELSRELIERFRIRAPGPETLAGALSGGNRQRLEVARAIASRPRVIVAHNICRGLDLAATAEVHRTILDFAASGGAVLLISSDLDELLAICGRLLILSRGKIRETNPGERDPERLGLLMAGARD
ncbi:MAG: ATP-binding cassette domain-containing protein [Candidatus Binatus sp.]